MDYIGVPTCVFTPLEYGCCGYDEETAKNKFGADNVKTYHVQFQPLEWQYNKMRPEGHQCYVKVLVTKNDGLVVGFHMCAPNAGEIT